MEYAIFCKWKEALKPVVTYHCQRRDADTCIKEKIHTDWSEWNDSRPEEKDWRVLLHEKVSMTQPHALAAQNASYILGWIKTGTANRSRQVIFPLYSISVRPHPEYCIQLWGTQEGHATC